MDFCRKFSKAKGYLEQAYLLQNDNIEVLSNRGLVNYELNQLPDAIFYFEKALELAPDKENVKPNLQCALEKLKNSNI